MAWNERNYQNFQGQQCLDFSSGYIQRARFQQNPPQNFYPSQGYPQSFNCPPQNQWRPHGHGDPRPSQVWGKSPGRFQRFQGPRGFRQQRPPLPPPQYQSFQLQGLGQCQDQGFVRPNFHTSFEVDEREKTKSANRNKKSNLKKKKLKHMKINEPEMWEKRQERKRAFKKKKKERAKVNKRLKKLDGEAVRYAHYCDTCDRGYSAEEDLKSHLAEHIQCNVPNCRFVAHAKVVANHKKLQHGPGSIAIKWTDTPQDIEKWRQERKKNFPSANNIAKKEELQMKREKQGNVLETKEFGKMKGRFKNKKGTGKDWKQRGRREDRNDSQEFSPSKKPKIEDSNQSEETEASQAVSLHPDCDPLSILATSGNASDNEDDANPKHSTAVNIAPKGTIGALGSLVTSYESEEEGPLERDNEENEEPETDVCRSEKTEELQEGVNKSDKIIEKSTNRDGAQKMPKPFSPRDDGKSSRKRTHRGTRGGQKNRKRKKFLLEMLLAPDIRKERNIILQCIRHVVNKNFYEDGADNNCVEQSNRNTVKQQQIKQELENQQKQQQPKQEKEQEKQQSAEELEEQLQQQKQQQQAEQQPDQEPQKQQQE